MYNIVYKIYIFVIFFNCFDYKLTTLVKYQIEKI